MTARNEFLRSISMRVSVADMRRTSLRLAVGVALATLSVVPSVAQAEDVCIFVPPDSLSAVNHTVLLAEAVNVAPSGASSSDSPQWTITLQVVDVYKDGGSPLSTDTLLVWTISECGREPAIGLDTGERYLVGIGRGFDPQAEGVFSDHLAMWHIADGSADLVRAVYNQPGALVRKLAAADSLPKILTLLGADELPPTDTDAGGWAEAVARLLRSFVADW